MKMKLEKKLEYADEATYHEFERQRMHFRAMNNFDVHQGYSETMEIEGFTSHVLAALNGVVPKNVSKVCSFLLPLCVRFGLILTFVLLIMCGCVSYLENVHHRECVLRLLLLPCVVGQGWCSAFVPLTKAPFQNSMFTGVPVALPRN